MKTIGMLGGTGWTSTITYYRLLNQGVREKLGGSHSARLILQSIDYHDLKTNYGIDDQKVCDVLTTELNALIALKPGCLMICNNTLHKYFDLIKDRLTLEVPVFHVVDLIAQSLKARNHQKVLLLATKFTLEDGYFTQSLSQHGIEVTIPEAEDRGRISAINLELGQNKVTQESRDYFKDLVKKYKDLDAVVVACTELPIVIDETNSCLPIIDPVPLQVQAALDFALDNAEKLLRTAG